MRNEQKKRSHELANGTMLQSPRTNAVRFFLIASALIIANRVLDFAEPIPLLRGDSRILTTDEAQELEPPQRLSQIKKPQQRRAMDVQSPDGEQGTRNMVAAKPRQNMQQSEEQQQGEKLTEKYRPPLIIHTFFQTIDGSSSGIPSGSYDEQMIESWKAAWKAKGWEPRILTLEDAKKHRLYSVFNEELDKVPLAGKSGKNAEYNRLCYLRWLAMASAGGGWMADYDTVPLYSPIEEDYRIGKFTVFEEIGVPSLSKGSAGEWERMALALLESAKSHANDEDLPLWSDMLALMEIIQSGKCECYTTNAVMEGVHVLNGKDIITPHECAKYGKRKAIHFSHHAIQNGDVGEKTMEERPAIMREWSDQYDKFCWERNEQARAAQLISKS